MHQPRTQFKKRAAAAPMECAPGKARAAASLGIAVVGAGRWGANLIRAVKRTRRANLELVCDTDAARLESVCRLHPVRTTTDYSSLLADGSIEAVIIATPPESHVDLTLGALEADKNVFVEKPMAPTLAQAWQLHRAVERTGRLLMVGHVLRYHAALQLIERWIESGELGVVHGVFATRSGTAATLDVLDAWWALAPHDISIARMIFGRDPLRVAARIETIASGRRVHAVLDYGSGARGTLRVSGDSCPKLRRMIVVTSRYLVVFDDLAAPGELRIHRAPSRRPTTFEEAERAIAAETAFHVPTEGREPLVVETECFVAAILDGNPVPTDVAEGCAVVAALEAGALSMRHGSAVIPITALEPAMRDDVLRVG